MKNYTIAIDGPAGSGKSTIAKIIAKEFNLTYLDTGAMYRTVSLYLLENQIDCRDEKKVVAALSNIKIDVLNDKFFLNGVDVSEKIRTPEVTAVVSFVSSFKEVRETLVNLQREISRGKSVILDGRDIGTVVFPNADLKIFLIASPEERARRRFADYLSKGIVESYETVLKNILERDYIDSNRKESPLKKASDAIEIDTSSINILESSKLISDLIKKKLGIPYVL